MANGIFKLSPREVETLSQPGRYADGGGLYLWVRPSTRKGAIPDTVVKSWLVRMQKDGRRRDIGLGGYPKLKLAAARKMAETVIEQMMQGIDPVAAREVASTCPTFAKASKARHKELVPSFRNAKHAAQWLTSLETYAWPVLGSLPVDSVTPAHVRDALLPIWLTKPETAKRVHQRIVDVLTWAVAKGHRTEVPLLSAKALALPKVDREAEHHAALAFDAVPAFFASLREREGVSRLALEALILTAARSGEIRGATWDEIDLEAKLWAVPGARMKRGKEHVVPLSPAAVAAFERAKQYRRDVEPGEPDLVFPSPHKGGALSDMALTKLLRDLGAGVTAHGFRSSFRDWAAEKTNVPNEVAEIALAHAIGSKTEAAYRRGALLEKRRELMNAWGRFCTCDGGKVVKLGVA